MHKSAIFSLLLFGSLVMLLLIPFVSTTNVIVNAIAQEYDNDNYYYENNSKQSKYPTNFNKYECQRGPFEGFFTSSVEFCKFKFDDNIKDNRDNKIGPQGPQGPQGERGPQGLTGQQGEPGPRQIESTNLYFVEGLLSVASQTSIAQCEVGDVVVEGGYAIGQTSGNPFELFEGPLPNPAIPAYIGPNNSAYGVLLIDLVGFTQFKAYAYCFDNSP